MYDYSIVSTSVPLIYMEFTSMYCFKLMILISAETSGFSWGTQSALLGFNGAHNVVTQP